MGELIFRRAGEDLMRVSLDRPTVSVGRGAHNDFAIPDEGVSRSQFSIVQRGSRTVLVDASGRGTRVAGVAAEEAELHDGAEIDLGLWSALYREGDTVAEAATDPRPRGTEHTREQPPEEGPRGALCVHVQDRIVAWPQGDLTIGSGPHNQLVVSDPFVSGSHLVLSRTPRGIALRDRGSTNGTFLNGSRLREGMVPLGAVIRIGGTELHVGRVASAAPSPGRRFGLVGRDPALQQVLADVERIGPTGGAVIIFGESGTGKELIAQALHTCSGRRDRPFVAINCAAFHRELVESELFGHERGAFTGADRARAGAFELASGGTLFLDEIGDLAPDLQAKLLRVLETGEVRRLGSSQVVHTEVRVVAATHVDLFRAMRRGTFREDLYFRLCVFSLRLPPLRSRGDDLLELAQHFITALQAGTPAHLSPSAAQKLATHPFRGNVRELKSVIQRALVRRSGATILPEHIVFDGPLTEPIPGRDPRSDDEEFLYLPDQTLEHLENEIVARALQRNIDKTATALELGISRTTVIKICQRRERGGPLRLPNR